MTVATANGSGTGRWHWLRRLTQVFGRQKRAKADRKAGAYNDYWQVRSHRGSSAVETSQK